MEGKQAGRATLLKATQPATEELVKTPTDWTPKPIFFLHPLGSGNLTQQACLCPLEAKIMWGKKYKVQCKAQHMAD